MEILFMILLGIILGLLPLDKIKKYYNINNTILYLRMIFCQINKIPGSSAVERSAVNRLVVSSNLTLGANC